MATVVNDVNPILAGGPFPVELRLRPIVGGTSVRVNVIDNASGSLVVVRNGITIMKFDLSANEIGVVKLPSASQTNNPLATEAEGVLAPEFSALETILAMLAILDKLAENMVANDSVFIVLRESVRPLYQSAPDVTLPLAVVGIIQSVGRKGFFEEYDYRVPDSMPENERGQIKLAEIATTRASQEFIFEEGARLSDPAIGFLRTRLQKRQVIPLCYNLFKTVYGVSPPAIEFIKEVTPDEESEEEDSVGGSIAGSIIGGGDDTLGYYVVPMPAFDGTEAAPIRKSLQDRKKGRQGSEYYGPKAEETQYVLLADSGPDLDPTGHRAAKATAQVQDWIQANVVLQPEFHEADDVTAQNKVDPMQTLRSTLWWPALGVYNGGNHLRRLWVGEEEVLPGYDVVDTASLVAVGCTCRDWVFRYAEDITCCKHMYAWNLYNEEP